MNKESLIQMVTAILENGGFTVSSRCDIRPRSFDLAARRGDVLLLIKTLSNIDGLNEETASEMKLLSMYLSGSPFVVGEKTRDHPLESGVVYFRYDIPALDVETIQEYLIDGTPPLVYAAHGGLYVRIDGPELKKTRMMKSISIGALASELGVSRRTISKYEEGGMDASVEVALKLEKILKTAFVLPVNVLEPAAQEQDIKTETRFNELVHLSDIGFDVLPTAQAPFNAISLYRKHGKDMSGTILTGISEYTNTMVKRAQLMSSISNVAMTESVFIVSGETKHTHIESTVLVQKTELNKIDDPDDFINLIQEKKTSWMS